MLVGFVLIVSVVEVEVLLNVFLLCWTDYLNINESNMVVDAADVIIIDDSVNIFYVRGVGCTADVFLEF